MNRPRRPRSLSDEAFQAKIRAYNASALEDKLKRFYWTANNGVVPEEFPLTNEEIQSNRSLGGILSETKVKLYNIGMTGIVDMTWTRDLAEMIGGKSVLQLCAGVGFLTQALRTYGIDIHATDSMLWRSPNKTNWRTVTEVEQLTISKSLLFYGSQADIILIAWPEKNANVATHLQISKHNNEIFYIGEGHGGKHATNLFHSNFREIYAIVSPKLMDIPKFPGNYDRMKYGKYVTSDFKGKRKSVFANAKKKSSRLPRRLDK